ncbi:MAG: hypothetical protein DWP95_06850 [Proteobacteria bacterium]|nr:MAG: hypothetical protein DWP95_06850 [Pseudomonadota bacterium]
MTEKEDIAVTIEGQKYHLDVNRPQSFQQIPWAQRKRLIHLLQLMQAADYVDPEKNKKNDSQQATNSKPNQPTQLTKKVIKPQLKNPQIPPHQNTPTQDSDVLMQRFLAEQKSHKHTIPSKASIYKWFLIVFAIIFIVILLL